MSKQPVNMTPHTFRCTIEVEVEIYASNISTARKIAQDYSERANQFDNLSLINEINSKWMQHLYLYGFQTGKEDASFGHISLDVSYDEPTHEVTANV